MGVPLFANTGKRPEPYERLYVPVRPGVWQAYQTDLAAVGFRTPSRIRDRS
jgi:hypothetical protein